MIIEILSHRIAIPALSNRVASCHIWLFKFKLIKFKIQFPLATFRAKQLHVAGGYYKDRIDIEYFHHYRCFWIELVYTFFGLLLS